MDRYRLIAVNERQAQMIVDTISATTPDPDAHDLYLKAAGVVLEFDLKGYVDQAAQIIELSKKDIKRMERQAKKEEKRANRNH